MYKTKETAIKHLESDKFEDFRHKNFNLFRDNEEVALVAIKKNYSAIEGVSDRLRNSVDFNRKAFEANSDVYLIQRHKDHLMQDREILKLCYNKDAFLTLNSLINMEKLQEQLKPKAPSQTRAMKI